MTEQTRADHRLREVTQNLRNRFKEIKKEPIPEDIRGALQKLEDQIADIEKQMEDDT